jgi:hypothetical protein
MADADRPRPGEVRRRRRFERRAPDDLLPVRPAFGRPRRPALAEIGRLDRGDEVEVLGEQDGMLQVRTPTGLLGWVPRVVIVG